MSPKSEPKPQDYGPRAAFVVENHDAGMTYREIAERFDTSPERVRAVYVQVKNAMKRDAAKS